MAGFTWGHVGQPRGMASTEWSYERRLGSQGVRPGLSSWSSWEVRHTAKEPRYGPVSQVQVVWASGRGERVGLRGWLGLRNWAMAGGGGCQPALPGILASEWFSQPAGTGPDSWCPRQS